MILEESWVRLNIAQVRRVQFFLQSFLPDKGLFRNEVAQFLTLFLGAVGVGSISLGEI